MPEKLLPATIRARVHEDAISRVTRFFNATTVETLNELFQNARRAGATKVDVTIDGGEVRVRDNGDGITDPAALLAFGRTGWDSKTARREDPAGMGVYSLARRAKVTIRSRPRPVAGTALPAWQVHLTPEHFLGHEIAPLHVIDSQKVTFGTEIVFEDDKANTGNVNSAARYFPLPVTCNGDDVDRIVELPVEIPTMPAFGGADLDTIFVTSIGPGGGFPTAPGQPQAGGVFAVDAGVSGLPEPRFAAGG